MPAKKVESQSQSQMAPAIRGRGRPAGGAKSAELKKKAPKKLFKREEDFKLSIFKVLK